MKRYALAPVVSLLISLPVYSQDDFTPTVDLPNYAASRLEYEIGGRYGSMPGFSGEQELFAPDLSLAWGYNSCSSHDFLTNLEQSFEQASDIAEEAVLIMLASINGFIATLPEYILQRLNPGLYELLTNFKLRFEDLFQLAVKDCKAYQDDIANGENPYQDFLKFYGFGKWRTLTAELDGEGVAIDIKEMVEDAVVNPEDGMLWVDNERYGGLDQEPIRVIGDLCARGYEMLAADGFITTYFPTEESVVTWCNEVLGESEYSLDGPFETPGLGLFNKITTVIEELNPLIDEVVTTDSVINADALTELSAGNYRVSNKTLDILRSLQGPERDLFKSRVISDVATSRVVEESLLILRVLMVGIRDNAVNNASPIRDTVLSRYIPELQREVDQIYYEQNIRSKMMSTLEALYDQNDVQNTGRNRTPSGLPNQTIIRERNTTIRAN